LVNKPSFSASLPCAAVIAGGGFRVGQVVGETDKPSEHSTEKTHAPEHGLASLYQDLGSIRRRRSTTGTTGRCPCSTTGT
jgi:hypothetical protein